MGSVAAGLASVGGSLAQAQELKRKEQIEQVKLALEQGKLGVEQQYADTNKQRLGMDQQREAQLSKLRDAQIAETMKRVNASPPMAQKLKDAEGALGRPLTDSEKLAALGIKLPTVPQSEYQKTTDRLRAEAEMFKQNPALAKLLHPGRAPAAGGSDTESNIEQKAKDIESGAMTLKDLSTKDRSAVATYMRNHKMAAGGGKLKPDQEAGLRVLHVSLFGDPTASDPTERKGLKDVVGVLDSWKSRKLLILAGAGQSPDPTRWTVTKMLHSGYYDAMSPQEKEYTYQLNRAVTAINALRTITGLPRSTQQLMDRYVMELADPNTTPSSKDAMTKIHLIEREIKAAKEGPSTGATDTSNTPVDIDKVLDGIMGAPSGGPIPKP
jgi:hypothetical protein